MKVMPLTQGMVAVIDDDDFELISHYKWYAAKTVAGWKATTNVNGKTVLMHRLIMGVNDPKVVVDHKHHNTLDNRKENLRVCTHLENNRNRRKSKGRKYKGVFPHWNRWRAGIRINKKLLWLGVFSTQPEAARAYDTAALKHFGEFALTNFK